MSEHETIQRWRRTLTGRPEATYPRVLVFMDTYGWSVAMIDSLHGAAVVPISFADHEQAMTRAREWATARWRLDYS